VALIIIGRAVLRTSGGDTDTRADLAEWTALSVSLALNILGGWDGGWAALGGAVAHSLGPLGAAGTAFLMGLFDTYIARADPWKGAQRLADVDLDTASAAHPEMPAQTLELPPVAQLDYVPPTAQNEPRPPRNERSEKPRKQEPGKPRKQPAQQSPTSGYAPGEDPATQAAQDVIAGRAESIRKAAQQYGVSDGTVRNRLAAIKATDTANGAQAEIVMTPIPEPMPTVTRGVNGHSLTTPDN
jgi:hypothetical protein